MGRAKRQFPFFPVPLASIETLRCIRHLLSPLDFSHFTFVVFVSIRNRVVRTVRKARIRRFVALPQGHAPFPTALAQHGSDRDHPQQLFAAFGARKAFCGQDFPLKNATAPHAGHVATFCFGGLHASADGLHAQHISSLSKQKGGTRLKVPPAGFDLPSAQGDTRCRANSVLLARFSTSDERLPVTGFGRNRAEISTSAVRIATLRR